MVNAHRMYQCSAGFLGARLEHKELLEQTGFVWPPNSYDCGSIQRHRLRKRRGSVAGRVPKRRKTLMELLDEGPQRWYEVRAYPHLGMNLVLGKVYGEFELLRRCKDKEKLLSML
eukprot:4698678-Amphidinium_carterae.1